MNKIERHDVIVFPDFACPFLFSTSNKNLNQCHLCSMYLLVAHALNVYRDITVVNAKVVLPINNYTRLLKGHPF